MERMSDQWKERAMKQIGPADRLRHLARKDLVPEQPLDVTAWVTVRMHSDGTISTCGTVGDKPMVLHLLDQATDAMKRQTDAPLIVIPNRDVTVMPSIPTRDLGDMPREDRGDP